MGTSRFGFFPLLASRRASDFGGAFEWQMSEIVMLLMTGELFASSLMLTLWASLQLFKVVTYKKSHLQVKPAF